MNEAINVLEDYRGKDAIIRTTSYLCTFLSGSTPPPLALKFGKMATAMSQCRVVLRLFDDLSMLKHNMACGTFRQEKHLLFRVLRVVQNQLNQGYYWVEKLAWAADLKLVNRESGKLWIFGLYIWALSLVISLMISFRALLKVQLQLQKSQGVSSVSSRELRQEQAAEGLAFVMNLADLVNAIGFMPRGFLWSGTVGPELSGVCGVIASVIKVYRVHLGLPGKADRILRSRATS